MAVDSAQERRGFLGVSTVGTIPTPDASIGAGDRALFQRVYTQSGAEPPAAPGATYTFNPPVRLVGARYLPSSRGSERMFFRRAAPIPVGISVLKIAGVWQSIQTPTLDQINAASHYYAGGHIHTVDATIAAELTAAGYGANLT